MRSPHSLHTSRVAIFGLGLMGGSLAMALKDFCAELFAIDTDEAICDLANRQKIVDLCTTRPEKNLARADLIILAAPVNSIISILNEMAEIHPGSAVILDLGSTKVEIVKAMQELPERFDPIGGHPMCGKEKGSLIHADANLFRGAPFALTRLTRTKPEGESLVLELVQVVGAYPVWMDAETHDRWAAATSHLPFLLANALASVTPVEVKPLIGPGFRSTARLAPESQEMMLDILETNRLNILSALGSFQDRLGMIEDAIRRGDYEALRELLSEGAQHYEDLNG